MEHKRQRIQFGWICLKERKKGPNVWALRYREADPSGGMKRRSVTVGTVKEFPTKSHALKAAISWTFAMNAESPKGLSVTFGAVIRRYLAEEIPERHSTASRYRSWLKIHIEPKWRDHSLDR